MNIKYKVWLEKDGKVIFGVGRDNLFKAIKKHHSINAALKSDAGIDMSYRAAWGRLRASQERLNIKLIESDNKRGGTSLTEEAEDLMNFFDKLDAKVKKIVEEASAELETIFNKSRKR